MITGLFLIDSTVAKPFELLKELRPKAITFGYLMNASNPGNPHFRVEVDNAARVLGIKVEIIELKEQSELADAFNRMGSLGVGVWPLFPTPFLLPTLQRLPSLLGCISSRPWVTSFFLMRVACSRSRRTTVLWQTLCMVCGSNSKGNSAGRLSGGTSDGVQALRQPEDR